MFWLVLLGWHPSAPSRDSLSPALVQKSPVTSIVECVQGFPDRRQRIRLMELVEIDPVALAPLQATFAAAMT
jgi:hypothetical protein